MIIGNFTKDKSGYTGAITTLTFQRTDVAFRPNKKGNKKEPDYRVQSETPAGTVEFGAAWKRNGEKGPYLSVELDDPAMPGTLNAALFTAEDGTTAQLHWRRRKPREDAEPASEE
jgi:uncharacterized protein (DUF736 family)